MKRPKNIYIIIFIIFAVWMIFFDGNSLLIHREVNKDINKLKKENDYYIKGIEKDDKEIKEILDSNGLETFARENYYMKKDNEDIYIIEYQDSINDQQNE